MPQSKKHNFLLESEEAPWGDDAQLYCGASVGTTRHRTMHCRRLKASCPFHGGPLHAAAVADADARTARAANEEPFVCGFACADGRVCRVPEHSCSEHFHWRAYREAELLQCIARLERSAAASREERQRLCRLHAFAAKTEPSSNSSSSNNEPSKP